MHTLLKNRNESSLNMAMTHSNLNVIAIKPELSPALRRKLLYMHVTSFDWERGGLQTPIKFLDRDAIEYSLTQAANHDRNEERMARKTLDAGLSLIDPVWGGIYQFSTQNDWHTPHYVRTMAGQAGCLRIYTLAYALLHELRYLIAARRIFTYMKDFLQSPEGAFYAGQSDLVDGIDPHNYFRLDDYFRRQHGLPAIDKTLCIRENGWAVEALVTFYEFTGEEAAMTPALQAGNWLVTNLSRYSRQKSITLPFADYLAAGRAMLQLFRITTDHNWLTHACGIADILARYFKAKDGGFNSRKQGLNIAFSSQQIDENISATRFLNLLGYYSGKSRYLKLAKHGLRYLALPHVATARIEEAGILLADEELGNAPVRITVYGEKTSEPAKKLYDTACRTFGWYKVIEWNQHLTSTACAHVTKADYHSDPVYVPDKLAWLIKSV